MGKAFWDIYMGGSLGGVNWNFGYYLALCKILDVQNPNLLGKEAEGVHRLKKISVFAPMLPGSCARSFKEAISNVTRWRLRPQACYC